MTPDQMAAQCIKAFDAGQTVTLTHAKGQKMPHGFPRGELLSESRGAVNMGYKPGHVLNWLRTNALIPPLEAQQPSRAGR